MSDDAKMGPCRCCGRHVRIDEHRCPFCGKTWLLGAAAAAGILLGSPSIAAPAPDAKMEAWEQDQDYGIERLPSENEVKAAAWMWDSVLLDWKASLGLSDTSKSWAAFKPGTSVTFKVGDGKATVNLAFQLTKVTDKAVTVGLRLGRGADTEKELALGGSIPSDAKVVSERKEEVELDGKKFSCTVKAYEWPGREITIWTCGDVKGGLVKIEQPKETTRLVKTEELTIAGKKRSCAVWETVYGETKITEWRAEGVPGLVVKRTDATKDKVTRTVEVVAINEQK